LVAVIMGMSAVAPALQQAFAHDVTEARIRQDLGGCPEGFTPVKPDFQGQHPDHNFNNRVCEKVLSDRVTITVDDTTSMLSRA